MGTRSTCRRDSHRALVDAPRIKDNRRAPGDGGVRALGEAHALPRFAIPTRALGLLYSIRSFDGLVWQ